MTRKKGLGKGGTSLELSQPYHVKKERVVTFHKKEEEIDREKVQENLFTWPFVWGTGLYRLLTPQGFMDHSLKLIRSSTNVYPAVLENWSKLFGGWQKGLFPWFPFK